MEVGTWAEWVGSIASIAAAVVSVFALAVAMKANRHAKEANATSSETLATSLKARSDALELASHQRKLEAAGELQGWWATTPDKEKWAVVLVNGARGAGVFRNIVLITKNADDRFRTPIPMLPPGTYVIEPEANGKGLPQPIDPAQRWEPLTRSSKHAVESIDFTDPVGERWRWDAKTGLRQAAVSHTS